MRTRRGFVAGGVVAILQHLAVRRESNRGGGGGGGGGGGRGRGRGTGDGEALFLEGEEQGDQLREEVGEDQADEDRLQEGLPVAAHGCAADRRRNAAGKPWRSEGGRGRGNGRTEAAVRAPDERNRGPSSRGSSEGARADGETLKFCGF